MARIFWPQLRVALLGAILLLNITQHHQSQASPSEPDFSTFTVEQACDHMADNIYLAVERYSQLLKQGNDAETLLIKVGMWEDNLWNFTERFKKPDDKLSETDQQMIQDMYNELKAYGVPGKLKIIPGTIQEMLSFALSRTALYWGIFTNLSNSSKDEVSLKAADDKVNALLGILNDFFKKYERDFSKYKEKPASEDMPRLQNAIDAAKEAVQKMLDAQSRDTQNEIPAEPAKNEESTSGENTKNDPIGPAMEEGSGQNQHPADQNVKPDLADLNIKTDSLELEEAPGKMAYFGEWATMRAGELVELIENAHGQEKDVLEEKKANFSEAARKWYVEMMILADDRARIMKPTGKLSKAEEVKMQAFFDEVKAFGESIKLATTPEMVALATSRWYLYKRMVYELCKDPTNVPFWNVANEKMTKLHDVREDFKGKYKMSNLGIKEKVWYIEATPEDVDNLNATIIDAKEAVHSMLKLVNSKPGVLKKLGHFAKKKYVWILAGLVVTTGLIYFLGSANQLVNQTKSMTASNLQFEAETAFTAVTKGISPLLAVVIIILLALLTGGAYYFFQKQHQVASKKMSTRKSCKKKSKTPDKSSKLTTQSPNQGSKMKINSTGKSSLQTAQVATTSPSSALTKATSKPKSQLPGSVIKQKTKASSALTPVTTADRR